MTTPRWRDDAACKDSPTPDLWHPVGSDATMTREKRAQIAAAKEVCAGCPVKDACLTEALADPKLTGIWGETTDRERSRMRNGTYAKCGTPSGYYRHLRAKETTCRACRIAVNEQNRERA